MRVVRLLLPKPKSAVHGPTLKEIMVVPKPKATRRKHTMEPKKKRWQSKTYRVVVVTVLGGVFTMLSPELQATLSKYVGEIMVAVGFIFGILREITKQPVR